MCSARQVVDLPLAESIRHHLDLQKDNQNARFVQKALKMYTSLANRAVRAGCAVDIFACSLDQVSLPIPLPLLPSRSSQADTSVFSSVHCPAGPTSRDAKVDCGAERKKERKNEERIYLALIHLVA